MITWLDTHSGFVMALLTAIYVLTTVLLAHSALRSHRLAEEHLKVTRELERPYVYAMPVANTIKAYFQQPAIAPTVTLRVKNIGRGPALVNHCICTAGLVASEADKPSAQFRWEVPEFALGPGDSVDRVFDVTSALPISVATIENIQRNIRLVYISPWVSYSDVAGTTHDSIETWRLYYEPGELRRQRVDRH
ncbi:MAG: hypothetical protein AB1762_17540, partial [Gemmatimonadota bacterium]